MSDNDLTPEDLYEGRECGCSTPTPAPDRSNLVKQLKVNARSMLAAAEQLSEPMEAVAEPMEAIAEPMMGPVAQDRGATLSTSTCLPWVRIVKDPTRFKACMALANRIGRVETSKQLYQIIKDALELEDQEIYVVIALDTQLMLRGFAEVARGARDRVLTPIQDTVRYAIAFAQLYGAQGIAIAHCHPSGRPQPSEADKDVTKAVQEACRANELLFLDHLVLGSDAYFSFRDAGLIK